MEMEFEKRAEVVYQEIKEILQKYNLQLDSDEGEGIVYHNKIKHETVSVESGLGHSEPWE